MNEPCGCCAGVEIVTPQSEANRPGLPALSYRVGAYATFFETMLTRLTSLNLTLQPNDVASWLLTPDDVLRPATLAADFKTPQDTPSAFLRAQFSPDIQHLLDQYDGASPPSHQLVQALAGALDALLQGASLYDPQRFAGVAVSSEIQKLLLANPQGQNLIRLNRLLLEAAYPRELARSEILYPLRRLTTRDPADPSIALLDAWAIVADVLTFYQQYIANEGFLRTATERRSILELARLIGYKLRPGVASSVYLAFTASSGFKGDIPAGARAQSIPGTGETPQFFETSDKLAARDVWNNLSPRLTRPQVITPPPKPDEKSLATGADGIDTLYFQGISTNLKTGDALLFVFGDDTGATPSQQVLRFVESVDAQANQKRTQVTLVQPSLQITSGEPNTTVVQNVQPFIDKARVLFPGSDIAGFVDNDGSIAVGSVASVLQNLINNVNSIPASTQAPETVAADFVRGVIPSVQQSQDITVKRGFTRLAAWIGHLLQTLRDLAQTLPGLKGSITGGGGQGSPLFLPSTLQASPLANLGATLDRLALPPSLQPANSQRLPRTVARTFAPQADIAPRLLAAFRPSAASTLYEAWANVGTPPSRVKAYALRAKASVFGHNAPLKPLLDANGRVVGYEEWPIAGSTTLGVALSSQSQATVSIESGTIIYSSTVAIGTTPQTIDLTLGTVEISPHIEGEFSIVSYTFTFNPNTPNPTTIAISWPIGQSQTVQINQAPASTVVENQTLRFPIGDSKITIALAQGRLTVTDESPLTPFSRNTVLLDVQYDKVLADSWTALVRADDPSFPSPEIRRVTSVQTISPSEYGITGKVTKLTLNDDWMPSTDLYLSALRNTTIYTQSEPLDLAEEPLDTDVEGDTIELADLYDGIEPGRWIIVSGNRTDIPNVSGVTASELAMIAGVNQGAEAPLCARLPAGFILPFLESPSSYTTNANAFGDRLFVGVLSPGAADMILRLPPGVANQKYCDQVQLAPGVYANAYVPTAVEVGGDFHDFLGLLVDPTTGVPYDKGNIGTPTDGGIFAWRISSEPVHTILTLASPLAYKYDARTVALFGNVVIATHGQTVAEVLGNGDASQAFQTFTLHQPPLTYLSAAKPAGAQSTLTVRVNEIEWHEADNLAALGPTDRGYVTQTDDADTTSVIFGNGQHGARTPTGSVNVKATYRYGIGKPGNVRAQQISQLATRPLGVQGVINPLPATGGADRDSADQARRNAPLAGKALDRLVGVEDYADFARTFAGIGKAAAARLSDGRRQLVHVTIAGADDIPIDPNSDLYRNLVQALHQYGDPYQPIQVCVRKVKLLVISSGISLLADYQWESVEPQIRATLLDAFSFDNRDLGQSCISERGGKHHARRRGRELCGCADYSMRVAEDVTASQLAGLAGTLQLNPFVPADLARLDRTADPAEPCRAHPAPRSWCS